MDQPTVDGFNVFFVAREARRAGMKVALSGLGGDELFGGYASFRDVPRALRWKHRLAPLRPLQRLVSSCLARTSSRRLVKAAEVLRREKTPVHLYFLRRELFLPAERRELHPLPADSNPSTGIANADLDELTELSRGLDELNQVSLFELRTYMRHMLLRDSDVFSMAHGLELRVPLLDHRLVEQVTALPGSFKRPDPRPKPLLLDAVGRRLPGVLQAQPKRGFTFPWREWLQGPLRERVEQSIRNSDVWSTLGVSSRAVRTIWERFCRQDGRVSALQILALVVLEDFAVRHRLRPAR
jgi:asparagine synthase (glutamine-hydrolysing)